MKCLFSISGIGSNIGLLFLILNSIYIDSIIIVFIKAN